MTFGGLNVFGIPKSAGCHDEAESIGPSPVSNQNSWFYMKIPTMAEHCLVEIILEHPFCPSSALFYERTRPQVRIWKKRGIFTKIM